MLHRLLTLLLVVSAFLAVRPAASAGTLHTAFFDASPLSQASNAYTPQEIATAYDFNPLYDQSLDGTGQTVALIEIDDYNPQDIKKFDQTYSLNDPTITTSYVGGRSFPVGHNGETTMDIEWLHALAPGAAIQVYYVNNNLNEVAEWRSMAGAVNSAVNGGAGVISISLGTCGTGPGSDFLRAALRSAMKSGTSVFVSSGDTGDRPGTVRTCGKRIGVGYPASDPSVVSVGGTTLHLDGAAGISRESGWHLSGGGKAVPILRPVWQVVPTLHHPRYRWAPDVAFVGDPNSGVAVYFKGHLWEAGGTSLGAPCWAAAWALIRQQADQSGVTLAAAPASIYKIANSSQYASSFHDITSGSNGHYRAGRGWDAVTGWGTPDVANLAQAVSGP